MASLSFWADFSALRASKSGVVLGGSGGRVAATVMGDIAWLQKMVRSRLTQGLQSYRLSSRSVEGVYERDIVLIYKGVNSRF